MSSGGDFSVLLARAVEHAETRRSENLRIFFADQLGVELSEIPDEIESEEFVSWFNSHGGIQLNLKYGRLFIGGAILC